MTPEQRKAMDEYHRARAAVQDAMEAGPIPWTAARELAANLVKKVKAAHPYITDEN